MNLKRRLGVVCIKLYAMFWNNLGNGLKKKKKFNRNWVFVQQLILFGYLRIIYFYVSFIVKSELEVFKILLQGFAINYLIFYVIELKIFYIIICIFMIYLCINVGEELYRGNYPTKIRDGLISNNWYKMESMYKSVIRLLDSEKNKK